jgi:chromosome segregation ATPase
VSRFEDVTDRPDFAEMRMGRMDGDGIAMGNEYSAVESQHDEIRRLRVELQSLKDANDRLQDERDKLSRQLEERTSINGLLQEQYRAIDDALHDVSAERDALQREVDRRGRAIEDANAEIARLSDLARERDHFEREVDRLRHQTGEARQPDESDKLRADVRRVDAQLNAAGETIAQLRQEQARLQARCREMEGWSEDIRLLRKAVRTLAKLR